MLNLASMEDYTEEHRIRVPTRKAGKEKVKDFLKDFMRDWSEYGMNERNEAYLPLIEAIESEFESS